MSWRGVASAVGGHEPDGGAVAVGVDVDPGDGDGHASPVGRDRGVGDRHETSDVPRQQGQRRRATVATCAGPTTTATCPEAAERRRRGRRRRRRPAGVERLITVGCDVAQSQRLRRPSPPPTPAWCGPPPACTPTRPSDGIDGLEALLGRRRRRRRGRVRPRLPLRPLAPRRPARRVRRPGRAGPRPRPRRSWSTPARRGPRPSTSSRPRACPSATVFHCFTGGPDEARRCLDLGGHLSFSGIVTFPSADDLREAAALCPADRLLVETDSPYLAPVPHRGKPNRPALVPVVGAAVAAARGEAVEAVAEATWTQRRTGVRPRRCGERCGVRRVALVTSAAVLVRSRATSPRPVTHARPTDRRPTHASPATASCRRGGRRSTGAALAVALGLDASSPCPSSCSTTCPSTGRSGRGRRGRRRAPTPTTTAGLDDDRCRRRPRPSRSTVEPPTHHDRPRRRRPRPRRRRPTAPPTTAAPPTTTTAPPPPPTTTPPPPAAAAAATGRRRRTPESGRRHVVPAPRRRVRPQDAAAGHGRHGHEPRQRRHAPPAR